MNAIENRAFLVYVFGYWGRGTTLQVAAQNCLRSGGRRKDIASAKLVLGDTTPEITSSGMIETDPGATVIPLGGGFKLGALLNLKP
jgi:hypothetical protein